MQRQSYINKAGLTISALASLYLSSVFFLGMSEGLTAVVFLAVGIASELGKYASVVIATTHHDSGNKRVAVRYFAVTAILVLVSVAGSAASLLATDTKQKTKHTDLESRIADIDQQINIELLAMERAASINAQTAGVAPARESIDILRTQKADLLKEKQEINLPDEKGMLALARDISVETGLSQERVQRIMAIVVAVLLEGLCLFFAVANAATTFTAEEVVTTTQGNEVSPGGSDEGSKKHSENQNQNQPDKFESLVAAIRSRELEPTHENIRVFMAMQSGKVKEVKERLKAKNVVVESSGGRLMPV